MSRWLAIAAYRCQINGAPTGSLDFQIRYFNLPDSSAVELALKDEPAHEYKNHLDETVSWPLVSILNIQGLIPTASGGELIGFIAETEYLDSLVRPDAA